MTGCQSACKLRFLQGLVEPLWRRHLLSVEPQD